MVCPVALPDPDFHLASVRARYPYVVQHGSSVARVCRRALEYHLVSNHEGPEQAAVVVLRL